jgi:hypothetical protein
MAGQMEVPSDERRVARVAGVRRHVWLKRPAVKTVSVKSWLPEILYAHHRPQASQPIRHAKLYALSLRLMAHRITRIIP